MHRGESITVRLEDFGAAPLVAEYDAEKRQIRVNKGMVDRMRLCHGDEAASALVDCAVAHEQYHALSALSGEEEAHRYAYLVTGHDPHALEAMLR